MTIDVVTHKLYHIVVVQHVKATSGQPARLPQASEPTGDAALVQSARQPLVRTAELPEGERELLAVLGEYRRALHALVVSNGSVEVVEGPATSILEQNCDRQRRRQGRQPIGGSRAGLPGPSCVG
jgi:hypothetical protein